MRALLRRLEDLEQQHQGKPPTMGACYVCCLKTLNHREGTASEWRPCKAACQQNIDRWNAEAASWAPMIAESRRKAADYMDNCDRPDLAAQLRGGRCATY